MKHRLKIKFIQVLVKSRQSIHKTKVKVNMVYDTSNPSIISRNFMHLMIETATKHSPAKQIAVSRKRMEEQILDELRNVG